MTVVEATLKRWRDGRGILSYVAEQFQVTPDPWQEDALLAFADPRPDKRRVSMQACAGPGKSAVLAWCGWWFLSVQGARGEHPKGIALSINGDNLRANLWAEFSKWQQRSVYLSSQFTWTASAISSNDHPNTWRLEARAWAKTANADEQGATLSGLHSQYVCVLVDESGAVPLSIARASEQALSRCTFGKIAQAGNPISLDGMLYEAAAPQRHLWTVIRISGDPDDPKRSNRIDHEWATQQIQLYGRENPWVKSYILGEFPEASINALLGVEEVERAMNRHLQKDSYNWSQKRIGVDVARFGDDRTVIFPRQGIVAFTPVVMRVARTTSIAARVAKGFGEWCPNGDGLILIDDTGHWGHGAVDALIVAGYPVVPIIASDPAIDKRYKNRRAEMWLEMAKWVKAGGKLPYLPAMVRELTSPTYTFLAGKFVLEDKDQVKQRIGVSPDLGDGLAQTFALPDQPAGMLARQRGRQEVTHEFDPYAVAGEEGGSGHALTEFNPYDYKE